MREGRATRAAAVTVFVVIRTGLVSPFCEWTLISAIPPLLSPTLTAWIQMGLFGEKIFDASYRIALFKP